MIKPDTTIIQIAGHNLFNVDFREYLKNKYPNFRSYLYKHSGEMEYYADSRIKIVKLAKLFTFSEQLKRISSILLTERNKEKNTIFFVEEYINAFLAVLFLKKTQKIYYFKVDWSYDHHSPVKRTIYNLFISRIEKYIFSRSTKILCLNRAILDKVRKLNTSKKNVSKFGLLLPLIKQDKESSIKKRNEFIFFGMLRRDQNIEKILDAIHLLKQYDGRPIIHFFGGWTSSAYEKAIKKLVSQKNLRGNSIFHGYTDSNDPKLISVARKCAFGFAFFDSDISHHVFYAWPTKILFYIKYNIRFFYKIGSSAIEHDILKTGLAIPLDRIDVQLSEIMEKHNPKNPQKHINTFLKIRTINQYF